MSFARANPRAAAISAIARWMRTGEYALDAVGGAGPVAVETVGGVLRNLSALEFALSRFVARRPGHAQKAALCVGAWLVLFAGVPGYAAVNETVAAAKRVAGVSPGFVNAVLRNLVRDSAAVMADLAAAPRHVRLSHPEPLLRHWTELFGEETADAICAADNSIPPVTAAPVPFSAPAGAESPAERLRERWRAAGIAAERRGPVVVVPSGVRVESLPGYAEGAFAIQDAATLQSVEMLAPRPGECILDCCAAPGGKALQAAALVGETGRVLAFDESERRLERLRGNVARLGFGGRVETGSCDASSPELPLLLAGRRVDAVLADVPCSNSGVFRRRPEARWRWSEAEVRDLAALQLAILRNVGRLGAGRVVYSTCSIDRWENGDVVAEFLRSPEGARYALADERLLLPGDCDGAYSALLVLNSAKSVPLCE